MAFVTVEDDTGSIEAVVFPNVFAKTRDCWEKDKIILIEGKAETREETVSLIVEKASLLEEAALKAKGKKSEVDFEIKIPSRIPSRKLVELNKLLKQSQGKNRIALVFVDVMGRKKRMVLPFGVNYTEELKEKINKIITGD